jgi:hypothetical protein
VRQVHRKEVDLALDPGDLRRLGGTPHIGMREWRWRRGGKIKFAHLQFDSTVFDWQGAQIALICF